MDKKISQQIAIVIIIIGFILALLVIYTGIDRGGPDVAEIREQIISIRQDIRNLDGLPEDERQERREELKSELEELEEELQRHLSTKEISQSATSSTQ